jgi:pyruvate/2-oxoglutarate dehydrogenase complex dihydrolipoamide dehydrogenase (E3) component
LDSVPYLTNETIFDLSTRPDHLIAIGAGPIGLELAQAFRRLGAAVTVLEAGEPLSREDPECARIVVDQIRQEGVALRSGVTVTGVEAQDSNIVVVVAGAAGTERIIGSHLLVATGRRPNTDGLGLDAAGIAHGPEGIVVDRGLRTGNRRVYAIGDIAGGPQFTHVASYHAGLVIRSALFRLPVRADHDLIARVTFTDPELAHVGLTEEQARRARKTIRVLRWPLSENDRAQADRDTRGHIKVVTDQGGRILGATIVGANAGELIATWVLALSRRLKIGAIAGIVVPYPTRAEIGKRAAISYFIPRLTRVFVRRIIGLLRRFG